MTDITTIQKLIAENQQDTLADVAQVLLDGLKTLSSEAYGQFTHAVAAETLAKAAEIAGRA